MSVVLSGYRALSASGQTVQQAVEQVRQHVVHGKRPHAPILNRFSLTCALPQLAALRLLMARIHNAVNAATGAPKFL